MKIQRSSLFLASLFALSACSGQDEAALMCIARAVPSFLTPPAEPCDSFSSVFAVKNASGMASSSFARGAPVTLELKITNNASTSKTLQVPDGCGQVVLEVDEEAAQICRVFSNAPTAGCTQAVVDSNFAPGETKTFSATWPQTRENGQPVGAGSFRAYGMDRSQCAAKFYSSSQPFTVQ